MKLTRFISVLATLCLLLSLAACGGDNPTAASSTPASTTGSTNDPVHGTTSVPSGTASTEPDSNTPQVSNPLGLKSLSLAAYLENAILDSGEPRAMDVSIAMLEGITDVTLSASGSSSSLRFSTEYDKNGALTCVRILCELDYQPDLSGEELRNFFSDLQIATNIGSITLRGLNIESVDGLDYYPNVTRLKLEECTGVTRLDSLAKMTGLQYLTISNMSVSDLSPLAGLADLLDLSVNFCPVTDISPLANLPKLENLNISSTDVTSLPAGGTTALLSLSCGGNASHLTDITNIAGWLGENAEVYFDALEISDLSGMEKVGPLRTLNLAGAQVSDASLQYLKNLTIQELLLNSCPITNLSGLSGSTGIRELYVYNTMITDVTPLASCTGLEYLHIAGTGVTDITPLLACADLKTLKITGLNVDTSAFEGTSISIVE